MFRKYWLSWTNCTKIWTTCFKRYSNFLKYIKKILFFNFKPTVLKTVSKYVPCFKLHFLNFQIFYLWKASVSCCSGRSTRNSKNSFFKRNRKSNFQVIFFKIYIYWWSFVNIKYNLLVFYCSDKSSCIKLRCAIIRRERDWRKIRHCFVVKH